MNNVRFNDRDVLSCVAVDRLASVSRVSIQITMWGPKPKKPLVIATQVVIKYGGGEVGFERKCKRVWWCAWRVGKPAEVLKWGLYSQTRLNRSARGTLIYAY
jgi:hypothetical protein